MGIKKRQYTKEQKEELVQSLLSGQTALGLGREHNISPSLINRWKRQYLNGQLGKNDNNQSKAIREKSSKRYSLRRRSSRLSMSTPITATGESPHNCIGKRSISIISVCLG
jgi:transposase-like protein